MIRILFIKLKEGLKIESKDRARIIKIISIISTVITFAAIVIIIINGKNVVNISNIGVLGAIICTISLWMQYAKEKKSK